MPTVGKWTPAEPKAIRVRKIRETAVGRGFLSSHRAFASSTVELEVLQVSGRTAAANQAESKDLKIVKENTKTECENQIIWEAEPNVEKLRDGWGTRKQSRSLTTLSLPHTSNNYTSDCCLFASQGSLHCSFLVEMLSGHLH